MLHTGVSHPRGGFNVGNGVSFIFLVSIPFVSNKTNDVRILFIMNQILTATE